MNELEDWLWQGVVCSQDHGRLLPDGDEPPCHDGHSFPVVAGFLSCPATNSRSRTPTETRR